MITDKEIAADMLRRLIAGERGNLPMHLAMLLERSSPLSNTDDHYRKILPADLAEVRLTAGTVKETIEVLCSEISRNPDAGLIAAASTTGAEAVTKLATELLLNPPRALNASEVGQALGVAYAYLP